MVSELVTAAAGQRKPGRARVSDPQKIEITDILQFFKDIHEFSRKLAKTCCIAKA
jgi:hypothetical protein